MENKLDPAKWICIHRHSGLEHKACYQRYIRQPEKKIGFFDIETSNLKADFGWIISWVIKHQGEDKYEQYVLSKQDYQGGTRDRRATEKLVEALNKFDMICGYYSTRFDIPFSRTRAYIHRVPFIPMRTIEHLDLYYTVRNKFLFSHNRLENAGDIFNFMTEKTRIKSSIWADVGLSYDREKLGYIQDHNLKDTALLEELYVFLLEDVPLQRRFI